MSRAARRWILFCLALLLTAGASYFEFLAIGAAWAATDVVELPSEQQLQAIRYCQHQFIIHAAEALASLIVASLCLGIAWRRGNSKHPITTYIKAFPVCLLASLLPIYVSFLLICLAMQ